MGLKEEIAELIVSTRRESQERVQKQTEARATARGWWESFREKELLPLLREAAEAWRAVTYASSGRKNGDSAFLGVGPNNGPPEHEITFRLDEETGSVRCESSESAVSETYEKGALTAGKAHDKLKEFSQALISNYV